MNRYARKLAAAMDDRQYRLGEHAAEHQPHWGLALGPVPEHPPDRADWEHRAGQIAAYREMWGWTHPHEPIGPRPGQHSPEASISWQAAAEALGYQPGSLREHSDGQLWAWRSVFTREMEWAPPYKGDDLAVVRAEIRRTEVEADRGRRNAEAANGAEAQQRLTDRASVLTQWAQRTRDLADRLADTQTAYDEWDRATAPSRDRAVAADAELRRRYPDQAMDPLQADQSTPEPEPPATAPEPARTEVVLTAWQDIGADSARFSEIVLQIGEINERLDQVAMHKANQARERAAEITSLRMEPDDPDAAPVAAWKSELEARQREAVRNQPMPRIPHAPSLAAEATSTTGREAAD